MAGGVAAASSSQHQAELGPVRQVTRGERELAALRGVQVSGLSGRNNKMFLCLINF